MNEPAPNNRTVFVLLAAISGGVIVLVLVLPSEVSRVFGACLVAAGVFNISLHRIIGRGHFKWSRTLPAFAANLWIQLGENGAQLLYLGIGVILVIAGLFLLVR